MMNIIKLSAYNIVVVLVIAALSISILRAIETKTGYDIPGV